MSKITACKSALLFIMLFVFNDIAFASSSLTYVSPNDKSVEWLGYIFGSVVNVINETGVGPAQPDSVIGALSQILNTGMLLFTGLIIGYVFLNGILNSAHEGNPLGKMYSSMWVPLRMVFALILVLPFAGGYSTMQIGVLWVAGQGIGLANSSMNAAFDFISRSGTLYPPQINTRYNELANAMLESRVCMKGINTADRHTNIVEDPIEETLSNSPPAPQSSATAAFNEDPSVHVVTQRYTSYYSWLDIKALGIQDFFGLSTSGNAAEYGEIACGSVSTSFNLIDSGLGFGPILQEYKDNLVAATAQLDADMDPIATAIVTLAVDTTDSAPLPDFLAYQAAVDRYKASYLEALNLAMGKIATARLNAFGALAVAGESTGAREAGWVTMGAWYWELQRINAETQKLVSIKHTIQSPSADVMNHSDYGSWKETLDLYNDMKIVTDKFGNSVTELKRSSYNDSHSLDFLLNRVHSAISFSLQNPDPVSGLANIGHVLIDAVEAAWLIQNLLEIPADIADVFAKKSGVPLLYGASISISKLLAASSDLLVLATILLLPLAIMLAFYLPATPLILWVMGVAGWFVLLIEAVIAAPIWAASHAMPEGNGFVGQRAMAGYMVMLSLFLRPTLMIFGFFASMTLMIVMGKTVSFIFLPYISSMNAGNLSGIVTLAGSLGVFTTLIIQIAHRSYGLINEVPDKVLRYIGGGAENLGEASNEQQARNMFVGGISKAIDKGHRGEQMKNNQTPKKPGGNGDKGDDKGGNNRKNTKTDDQLSPT